MLKVFQKSFRDEDGAVTVDWVVLTAGIVAFNVIVLLSMIEGGINVGASVILSDIETAVSFIN